MVWDRTQSRDSGHFWLYLRTAGLSSWQAALALANCFSQFPTLKQIALLPSWGFRVPPPSKFVRVRLLVKGLIRNLVVWDRKQSRESGHFWLYLRTAWFGTGSNPEILDISGWTQTFQPSKIVHSWKGTYFRDFGYIFFCNTYPFCFSGE